MKSSCVHHSQWYLTKCQVCGLSCRNYRKTKFKLKIEVEIFQFFNQQFVEFSIFLSAFCQWIEYISNVTFFQTEWPEIKWIQRSKPMPISLPPMRNDSFFTECEWASKNSCNYWTMCPEKCGCVTVRSIVLWSQLSKCVCVRVYTLFSLRYCSNAVGCVRSNFAVVPLKFIGISTASEIIYFN